MVRPALRSRSWRRLKARTPGGKQVLRFEKRKPSPAKCAGCKKSLGGVPRARQKKVQKMPKNRKRPERVFGGVLCPACTKARIKEEKVYKAEGK
ncbi:MAG: 50S ribosomal protein L34e [Candidatus Aenigmatarchaeota archaeon]